MWVSLVIMTPFPFDFGRDFVGSTYSELKWVINQIALDSDAHMAGVFILGMMINHSAGVGDYSIAWDGANVSVGEKKMVLVPFVMPGHPCAKQ
jgi:hypothetical protein